MAGMVDAHEPLGRCPENDRVMTPPAMRIRVRIGVFGHQSAAFAQGGDDADVSVPNRLAREAVPGLES